MNQPAIDPADVLAAVNELKTIRTGVVYDPETELLTAGIFVADYGSLGDWWADLTDLHQVRSWIGSLDAAWSLISHWSVQRGDPTVDPPESFDEHEQTCPHCKYLETALGIHMMFETENCYECGLDIDKHEIAPDALGLAHAWCCAVNWTRREPWVHGNNWPGGDNQKEDAWDCEWWTQLSDGTYGVVTRYFYVAADLDVDSDTEGDSYIECRTEYMVCTDWDRPGDTEINSDQQYETVDDTATMDTRELAMKAEEPTSAEWVAYAPEFAQQLLVAGHPIAA
jgi:hypothetical protein